MSNEELVILIKNNIDRNTNLEQLYFQNIKFIRKVVKKYARNNEDLEDLMQQAYICTILAAKYYEDKGAKYLTVLKWYLQRAGYNAARGYNYDLSLDTPISEDNEITLLDLIEDKEIIKPDDIIKNIELRHLLENIINKHLTDMESDIIRSHYFKNMTFNQLAEKYKLSFQRISALEHGALWKLRRNKTVYSQLEGYEIGWKFRGGAKAYSHSQSSVVEKEILWRENMLERLQKHNK